jgi:hypothetical protein
MHKDGSSTAAVARPEVQTEAGADRRWWHRTAGLTSAALVAGVGLVLLLAGAAAGMLLRTSLPLYHSPPWINLALFGYAVLLAVVGMVVAGRVAAARAPRYGRTAAAASGRIGAEPSAPVALQQPRAALAPAGPEPATRPRPGAGREPLRHFQVDAGSGRQVVAASRVEWIEACGNYVRLHLREGSRLYRAPLARLEAELDEARFLRIHRSTIVNLSVVEAVEPLPSGDATLRLTSGAQVRLSRRYARTFHERTGRPC